MVADNRPLLIITARVGSSRLPGKVLKTFWKQYCALEFLIKRLQTMHETSRIVLATVDTPQNDPVSEIGKRCGIKVVKGAEANVLERMSLCLEDESAEIVARITADNPFTDPVLFLLQMEEMKRVKADYSYCRVCPKGTIADIWTIESFNSTVFNASTPYELEHVNAWIWNHPELYKILWFNPPEDYIDHNNLNLSIDSEEEFREVSKYASFFEDPLIADTSDLIKLSTKNHSNHKYD